MAQDPIPPGDDGFHGFLGDITDYIVTNGVAMDLDADQILALTGVTGTWNTAFPAHRTASKIASGAAATKNNARYGAEGVLRPIIQQLQTSRKVTDAQRRAMKIPIHSTSRTPAGIPTTTPMGTLGTSSRLQHSVQFRDSVATGSKAKPAGVRGCEIWIKIGGPAPTDDSQMTFVKLATRTPYLIKYPGAQAGLTVYIWLRWVNTLGETGPWSEVLTATIPG